MRRFLLSNNNKFNGEISLTYNDKGTLYIVDMCGTDISEQTILLFLNCVPESIPALANSRRLSKDTIIVEAEFDITFDMFWTNYGKKINRKRCEPLFNKLSKEKQVKALYGIHTYNKFLSKETWRSKADPESYLRNEMWENEWK